MRIPEATIRKITEDADIVAIIGEHIKLEKKGNDFKGVCPFHNDTNPSLSVSPSKKVFKCFSCGAAGNAVGFIQRYKNLSFPQAIKYIGERMGISVDLDENDENQNLTRYYKIMQDATNYYEFYLKNSKEGSEAISYLHNRHLDDEIIKKFKIGLSSSEMDLLYKALTEKENPYLPLNLLEVGLVKAGKENTYYDVFRSRIIFPIEDFNGNVVGFSGRIFKKANKEEPKYVNSSENIIFKKSNILYNFSNSINLIKQKNYVFIFEGFMDVIAAFRANVKKSIATMGTALTKQQIQAIKKVTSNIILCFDGDNAGIIATKRAIQLFTVEKFNIRVMLLPEGLDPDEYAEKYGLDKLNDFLENKSITAIEYLYELEKRDLNVDDPYSIENFKSNVYNYLKFFNTGSVNQYILKKVATDLQTTLEVITDDFDKNKNNTDIFIKKEKTVKVKTIHEKKKYIRSENAIIYYAYISRENCLKLFDEAVSFEVIDIKNRNILYSIFDYYKTNDKINDDFITGIDEAELLKVNEKLKDIKKEKLLSMEEYMRVLIEYRNEKIQKRILENNKDCEFDEKTLNDYIKAKRANTKIIKHKE